MHSKMQGGFGVANIATYLMSRNIPCFAELFCDNSEIDLIAETPQGLKTIQVRSTKSINGAVRLSLRSITPGTRNTPCKISRIIGAEIFALYVIDRDTILFIDANEIRDIATNVIFRFETPKNNQKRGVRWAKDYMQPSFLKGR